VAPKSNATKKSYSLTWPDEIVGTVVFLASFLAVSDVYQLVPMLMVLGCATTITTFLILKTWRLLRTKELSFYRFDLKSSARIRKADGGFLSFAEKHFQRAIELDPGFQARRKSGRQ